MSNKTQQNGSYEVVNKKCAGIDVHRDFVSVYAFSLIFSNRITIFSNRQFL